MTSPKKLNSITPKNDFSNSNSEDLKKIRRCFLWRYQILDIKSNSRVLHQNVWKSGKNSGFTRTALKINSGMRLYHFHSRYRYQYEYHSFNQYRYRYSRRWRNKITQANKNRLFSKRTRNFIHILEQSGVLNTMLPSDLS